MRPNGFTASAIAARRETSLDTKGARLRELTIHRRTDLSLNELGAWLNPIVAEWMRYRGQCWAPGAAIPPVTHRPLFAVARRVPGDGFLDQRARKTSFVDPTEQTIWQDVDSRERVGGFSPVLCEVRFGGPEKVRKRSLVNYTSSHDGLPARQHPAN